MSHSPAVASNNGPDRPAIDCRVYERQPCEIPTKCHPASLLDMKEDGWSGAICDISQGGVRIRLPRRFERGTGLAIELPGDGVREPSTVFVKVVHIRALEDGSWALGCKFISDLSADEVNRLLTSDQYVLSSTLEENIETAAIEDAQETVEVDLKPKL